MEHSTEYDIKSQHMTPFEELLAERGGPPAYVAPPAPSAPYRTPDFRSMQNENAYLLGHAKTHVNFDQISDEFIKGVFHRCDDVSSCTMEKLKLKEEL